jgi:hypothetical protein
MQYFKHYFYPSNDVAILYYIFSYQKILLKVLMVSLMLSLEISVAIVKGEKDKRIFPRFNDPGKDAAYAINDYLNLVFGSPQSHKVPENNQPQDDEMYCRVFWTIKYLLKTLGELASKLYTANSNSQNGEVCYSIITPKGYKVENLGEEQVLQIINDIETYKEECLIIVGPETLQAQFFFLISTELSHKI